MGGRSLTTGEIELARELFKDSIRYERVRIHNGKYFFWQPPDSGMTPNGEIYANGYPYSNDYAAESLDLRAFFIHEMAHVWQYQNKILRVKLAAVCGQIRHLGNYPEMYKYRLQSGKRLIDYGIEQQASIIEDYYIVIMTGGAEFRSGRIQNKGSSAKKIRLLKNVMADFAADPTRPIR